MQWRGPYIVEIRVGANDYRIKMGSKTKTYHVNMWYHCDDKHITETNLLTLSNNVYLMFYAKEVDLGT